MKFSMSYVVGALALLMGCNPEENLPALGEGDGRLGLAFALNTSTQANARVMQDRIQIERGYIQIEELELELDGRDENGDFEREMEIDFPQPKKIEFDRFDTSEDFFIQIPEGEYDEIELSLDLIDYRSEPSIYMEGIASDGDGTTYQLIFEYYNDEIEFELEIEADDDRYFRVDQTNNPLILFELNPDSWFGVVSTSDIQNAEKRDGIIYLNPQENRALFRRVASKIEEAVDVEIEIN
ncbi:hypothetical protein [Lunatimonas salinarum]|uniref:hypothetical protein n=1 Tax=Lunatimonas salinarum TaxID=1774590 RepID=UPI001ADECE3F|nr:hypothetical protein [Lunatimonas salinarum]